MVADLAMLAETVGVALRHRGHRVEVVPRPVEAAGAEAADPLPPEAEVGVLLCGTDDDANVLAVAALVRTTAVPWLVLLDPTRPKARDRVLRAGAAAVLSAECGLDALEGAVLELAAGRAARGTEITYEAEPTVEPQVAPEVTSELATGAVTRLVT